MSKRKVSLEEAKGILQSDKVFYNGYNKFNVLDIGKYNSGITIEVPQDWVIGSDRKPENPIRYIESKELTDGMNIDFDGSTSILLGNYRLSKNGRPVFELTDPTKAQDVLIRTSWGGPFNKTRGQSKSYAEEVGALFFISRSSNGGGAGSDYWILPVDFVYGMPSRNVSEILENIEKKENERIAQIDSVIEKEDLEIKNSIENRSRILSQLEPILQSIVVLKPGFTYTAGEDIFIYSSHTRRYTDELVGEIQKVLEEAQNEKRAKDTYLPMFKEMESSISEFGISLIYKNTCVNTNSSISRFSYRTYSYSQNGFNSFINDITQYQEELAQEREEARIKAEEIRRAAELKRMKDEAKKMNYPELFEFSNRINGATGLSHAFVIERDGTIREPDYNNLRNNNHRHHTNWLNCADGTQGYEQLLPGEIIISYTKAYTAVPYIFNVEWADDEITEAQLEVILEKLSEKSSFASDIDEKPITNLKSWIREAASVKAKECRKQLHLHDSNDFAEEIVDLATQKAIAQDRNSQAAQLTDAYQSQLGPKSLDEED